MQITVVGTGFMGGVLGRALATAGHDVTFGSRRPDSDDVAATTSARAAPVADALASAEVVVLALPGAAVGELAAEHRRELEGKLVIDATNQMGQAVANARACFPRASVMPGRSTPWAGKTWRSRCSQTGSVPTCSFPLPGATVPPWNRSFPPWVCDPFTSARTRRR